MKSGPEAFLRQERIEKAFQEGADAVVIDRLEKSLGVDFRRLLSCKSQVLSRKGKLSLKQLLGDSQLQTRVPPTY